MISRRNFVSGAGTILVMGGVPAVLVAAPKGGSSSVTFAGGLRKSTFEALLSQNFYVETRSDGVMVLQLSSMKNGSVSQGRIKTEGFTLYFRGLPSPMLAEGIYSLEHGSAGKVSLYLEPAQQLVEYASYRAQCCLLV